MILTVLLVEAVVIGSLVGATAGWGAGISVGALAAGMPIVVVNIMARIFARTGIIGRLRVTHPLREGAFDPANGPARLSSISLGSKWLSVNGCVRLAADDDHLHLLIEMPLAPTSAGASVPWEAFEVVRRDGSLTALQLFDDGGRLWIPWKFGEAEAELRASIENDAT